MAGAGVVPPDGLVARARALAPTLRERQRDAEAARRIPLASIETMRAAGLYRVQQPKLYGGYEHGLDTFVRVAAEIAAGCGSTGWVFSTGAQHQWQIGMFPPDGQDEMWGEAPEALAGSSYAPTGVAVPEPGGFRVSGRWSFCSGVDICQWMIIGVRIAEAADAEPTGFGFVLVPAADYRIEPNWDVIGLEATGSNDIVLDGVFVPAHRMLTREQALSGSPPGAAVNDGDLFRIPFFAAISICLCAAILGMAQGTLEAFGAETGRPPPGAAAAGIDAARTLVLRDCRDIMATMAAGRKLTELQRARNKGDLGFAVRLCMRAADLLFEATGEAGLDRASLVQRAWRDLNAGAKHISMNWDAVGSLYGRVMLGLPPGPAQF